jgi:hypothetical protein
MCSCKERASLVSEVNPDKQEEFFAEVTRQLDRVDSFYKLQEADLNHKLTNLMLEVDQLTSLLSDVRTRNLRGTRRKRMTLQKAFCELYLHLSLLKNFQQLNHDGFRKILKKHDKLAQSDRGTSLYKRSVLNSDFYTSKEINELIKKTEDVMINQLESGNRGRAMSKLRVPPLGTETSHWNSYKSGLLMGMMFICIIVGLITLGFRIHDQPWKSSTGLTEDGAIIAAAIGLRTGFIITLWLFGFAINTFIWRAAGVNNVLIFEFDPRNYLRFQQLFEVAALVGVLWLLGVLIFLFSTWLSIPEYIGPLFTWVVIVGLVLFPVKLIYHRSRIWLLKVLGRIILAPFFTVKFADFWIADQLNSLAIVFLDMEFFFCYIFYGQFASPDNFIQCGSVYYVLRPLLAILPSWWRLGQCLRRYYETRQAFPHLVNAGKYTSSIVVTVLSAIATGLYLKNEDHQTPYYYVFFVAWLLSAIFSSGYSFAWDVKMDWGLFKRGYLIRKETIYPKWIYVLAIIEDFFLRMIWTFNISVGEGGSNLLNNNILRTIFGVLEVFRRIVWNFFRLENEHLNNCGQFRVVRDISIHPFTINEAIQDDDETGPAHASFIGAIRRRSSTTLSVFNLRRPSIQETQPRQPQSLEEPLDGVVVETEHEGLSLTVPEQSIEQIVIEVDDNGADYETHNGTDYETPSTNTTVQVEEIVAEINS